MNVINRNVWKVVRRLKVGVDLFTGLDFARNISLTELGISEKAGNLYSVTPTSDLKKILKKLDIQSTDAILDYGAGKGAAMVLMARFGFNFIGGVEFYLPLCEIAAKNLQKLGIKNARVYHSNAKDFKNLDRYTHFYLFNPFPGVILADVLQHIIASHHRNQRRLTLIYYNPAWREEIDKLDFFELKSSSMCRYNEMLIYTHFD
ncbi:MAG: hypothetical protein K9J46_09120 [Saprospiraceae bacterium]|nr:hypothetical protein [Saprospiraceae bacterium]